MSARPRHRPSDADAAAQPRGTRRGAGRTCAADLREIAARRRRDGGRRAWRRAVRRPRPTRSWCSSTAAAPTDLVAWARASSARCACASSRASDGTGHAADAIGQVAGRRAADPAGKLRGRRRRLCLPTRPLRHRARRRRQRGADRAAPTTPRTRSRSARPRSARARRALRPDRPDHRRQAASGSRPRCAIPAAAPTVRLDGVYLLAGAAPRRPDHRGRHHAGTDGDDQPADQGRRRATRRAASSRARSWSSAGADRTDARMGHHALILSDRGRGRRQAGAGDLRRRRVLRPRQYGRRPGRGARCSTPASAACPTARPRAMLTEAFVGEVVDRIEHEGAREVGPRLGRRDGWGV